MAVAQTHLSPDRILFDLLLISEKLSRTCVAQQYGGGQLAVSHSIDLGDSTGTGTGTGTGHALEIPNGTVTSQTRLLMSACA
jgi:hypothetical protein